MGNNAYCPDAEPPGPNVQNGVGIHKVHQDIEKVKSDAEISSKIVDENGEPILAYHGNSREKRLNVLDLGRGQNAEAVWNAKDINNDPAEGTNAATRPFPGKEKGDTVTDAAERFVFPF